jgi:hypothetical protein
MEKINTPEEHTCTAFCNLDNPRCDDCPNVKTLADTAYEEEKAGNINFWSIPDDDPEVKYWKAVWIKGYKAALQSSSEKDARIAELEKEIEDIKTGQDSNAFMLVKLLDLCDRCYHQIKHNPPHKETMAFNEYESILEELDYYRKPSNEPTEREQMVETIALLEEALRQALKTSEMVPSVRRDCESALSSIKEKE